MKPSVFIGSSSEGLEWGKAVRAALDTDAEITMWNEGFFPLGVGFLEALVDALPRFDFAILILSSDDRIESRGEELASPRDNVLFELGLFMGHLGRARTFVVRDEDAKLKLPSDFLGVSMATYRQRQDKNVVAAVGAACDKIRGVIRELGLRPSKLNQQIGEVRAEVQAQKRELESLSFLISYFVTDDEVRHMTKLASEAPFFYHKTDPFAAELRRLRSLKFIDNYPEKGIRSLPAQGDLKDSFFLTERGKSYLKLRADWDVHD